MNIPKSLYAPKKFLWRKKPISILFAAAFVLILAFVAKFSFKAFAEPPYIRNGQFEDSQASEKQANTLQNGDLEEPYFNDPDFQHRTPNSWQSFTISGVTQSGPDTAIKRTQSASYTISGANWIAGIYQQRPGAVIGRQYTITAYVRGTDSSQSFWAGIDPTGGTNPSASSIQWGYQMTPGPSWSLVTVTVTAASPVITIFLKARNTSPTNKSVWIDSGYLGGCSGQSSLAEWNTPSGYSSWEVFAEGVSPGGCPYESRNVPPYSGKWIGATGNFDTKSCCAYQKIGTTPGAIISVYAQAYSHGQGAVDTNPSSPTFNCLILSPNRFGETNVLLGLDPYGGTNPDSPNVRWSSPRQTQDWREYWTAHNLKPCPLPPDDRLDAREGYWQKIGVCAVAQSSNVTIFLKSDHFYPIGWNISGFDDVTLEPPTLCNSVGAARALMNDTNIELVGDENNDIVVTY